MGDRTSGRRWTTLRREAGAGILRAPREKVAAPLSALTEIFYATEPARRRELDRMSVYALERLRRTF